MGLETLVDKIVLSTGDFIGKIIVSSRGEEDVEAEVSDNQDRLANNLLKIRYSNGEGYIPIRAAVFRIEGNDYSLSNIANNAVKLAEGKLYLSSRNGNEKYIWINIEDHKNVRLNIKILKDGYIRDNPKIAGLYSLADSLSKKFSWFGDAARKLNYSLTRYQELAGNMQAQRAARRELKERDRQIRMHVRQANRIYFWAILPYILGGVIDSAYSSLKKAIQKLKIP